MHHTIGKGLRMYERTADMIFAAFDLDRSSPTPLHRQLYDGLRAAALDGRLGAGTRLPSSRALAEELGVSRNTVLGALTQLLAEGYLEGRVGSGTYVSRSLPDDLIRARSEKAHVRRRTDARRDLSRRGRLLAGTASVYPYQGEPRAFRSGLPALDVFPFEEWRRLSARRWRRPPQGLLAYGDPAGYRPLREQIAARLKVTRAVRCGWEQVIVVGGAQQGLDLCARVLLDPDDLAWVEDPGYPNSTGALVGAGVRTVPVPVDDEGLDVGAGKELCADARLACVCPSNQFPLGVTMSLGRRLGLLEWASRSGAWIVEDDYGSEYRYAGRPLAALQSLDAEDRVVYLGTFSKALFPALRLGYVVAPPDLVDAFVSARLLSAMHAPTLEQAVLADFMAEGHFARHIRRARALHAERQAVLVDEARRRLAGLLELDRAESGLHLVGWLPVGVDDMEVSRRVEAHDLEAPPLSIHGTRKLEKGGLLLGYAPFDDRRIHEGVRRLERALT